MAEAEAPRLVLTVVEGEHTGQSFTAAGPGVIQVGRGSDTQFTLPRDRFLSRHHFAINFQPNRCEISDRGSRSGTRVNNAPIKGPTLLRHGDLIRAGGTVFRVSLEARPPAPPPPPPSDTLPRATSAAPTERHPGAPAIPGYRIERELGRGAVGLVYLAHSNGGDLVAIKTVLPAVPVTSEALFRFRREANILRGLKHPNIVAFHDSGECEGQLYFVMEYVPGRSAEALVRAEGPLPPARGVALALQLLDALGYAHARGFVHRDVKPANLLVRQERGAEVLKVTDFGLARTYQDSQMGGVTVKGTPGGTPDFMPPEQARDLSSARPPADVYSAAATLYFLLTGQHIYGPCTHPVQMFYRLFHEEPLVFRPEAEGTLPPRLLAVIRRALARKPEDRYSDANAMRAELAVALD